MVKKNNAKCTPFYKEYGVILTRTRFFSVSYKEYFLLVFLSNTVNYYLYKICNSSFVHIMSHSIFLVIFRNISKSYQIEYKQFDFILSL